MLTSDWLMSKFYHVLTIIKQSSSTCCLKEFRDVIVFNYWTKILLSVHTHTHTQSYYLLRKCNSHDCWLKDESQLYSFYSLFYGCWDGLQTGNKG